MVFIPVRGLQYCLNVPGVTAPGSAQLSSSPTPCFGVGLYCIMDVGAPCSPHIQGCDDPKGPSWVPSALRPHQPPPFSVPSLWLRGVPCGHCFQYPRQEADPIPLCVQSSDLSGVWPDTLHFRADVVEVLGARPLLVSLIFFLDYSLPQPRVILTYLG